MNRGWVPMGPDRERLPAIESPPGEMEFRGGRRSPARAAVRNRSVVAGGSPNGTANSCTPYIHAYAVHKHKRGFCPSCGARRMAESAAWLVDEVLPHLPMPALPAQRYFALR